MNKYIVTISPKYRAHSGSWSSGEYTVTVYAKSKREANSRARKGYEDSKMNPATFTAKLADGSEE